MLSFTRSPWACAALSNEQLNAEPNSTTKGNIRHTLQHLVEAQDMYWILLVDLKPRFNWQDLPDFAELQQAARIAGEGLQALARDEVNKIEMNDQKVAIPLKRFLLIEQCPEAWRGLDLYIFRDEAVVFYVGQSHLAFARVWEHLINGFKGHSITGRFVWCNWPKSMKFNIELLSSQGEQFKSIGNDLNAAERLLIQQWSPCFNVSHNPQPRPLPASYLPPNAKLRRRRSLRKLIYEAERAVKVEDNQIW